TVSITCRAMVITVTIVPIIALITVKITVNAAAVPVVMLSPQRSHAATIKSRIDRMMSRIGPIIIVTKSHTTLRAVPTTSTTAFHAFTNVVTSVSPGHSQKISTERMFPLTMYHTTSTAPRTTFHNVFQTKVLLSRFAPRLEVHNSTTDPIIDSTLS